MRLVLDGMTAFEFWMCTVSCHAHRYVELPNPGLTSFESKSAAEITRILERTEGECGALELLVRDADERRRTSQIRCTLWGKRRLPPRSLCHIGDGVYAVSPELCALRLALLLPRPEYLRALAGLLGIFTFSLSNREDLVSREPILTKARLAEYFENVEGVPGLKQARQALAWVPERSASPRESTMDLCLALPTRLGGQALYPFEANYEVRPDDKSRLLTQKRSLVADVAWPDAGLFLEYNSSKHHDTEQQKEFDFEKITTFQSMKKTVMPVSTRQFNDYHAFSAISDRIRTELGKRDRNAGRWEDKREALHRELLRLERRQRLSPRLLDTARWRFLLPYIDMENPL